MVKNLADNTYMRVYDKDGKDISKACKLINGKSNPFGWSQYEIILDNKKLGFLENGYVFLNRESEKLYSIKKIT